MSAGRSAVERLSDLPIWPAPPVCAPIPGGRTNENFRVDAGGRTFFARIGVDLPHHNISRRTEIRCIGLAAAAGVSPPVLHAGDGILVTEFVPGATLVQGQPVEDGVLKGLGQALRRLCATPAPPDLSPFDPVDICRGYLAALPADTISARRMTRAGYILAATPHLSDRWLIHADLIPENVIVAPGRITIVDWEYAGRGDPAVDAAAVVMNFGLDARQADLFVEAHGGIDGDLVKALEPVMALREALWCETQRHFVGVRGDLDDYTTLCWKRIDAMPE